MTKTLYQILPIGLVLLLGCAQEGSQTGTDGSDGAVGGNGGGRSGSGGTSASGGSSAKGGTSGNGGSTGAVGSSATDGSLAAGGSSVVGGSSATGGSSGAGGSSATGGNSATGGGSATGGSSSLGGATGSGGTSAVGGSSDAGGPPASGGSNGADAGDAGRSDAQKTDTTPTGGSSGCKAATAAQAPSGTTPLRAIDGFVTRDGSDLKLCGETFSVFGTNLYYLQTYSVYESGNLRTVADGLDDAVRLSLPVVRMWAFYDGSGNDSAYIQTAAGKFAESGLVGLDTAIAEAKKRGIRVILTLTNYWDGYGGLPQYAKWAGAANADAFYTSATMKGYFKDYAAMLSKRTNTVTKVAYIDEPTILAWEIANELRCPSCSDASAVTSTIDELSKYLKSLFPNHLIADGGEGMDDTASNWGTFSNNYPVSGWERTSFTNMVKLSALDLVSYHYYPVDWGMKADAADADGKVWIDGHQALAKAAGKVAYWGELGFQKNASDAVRAPIYDTWLADFYSSSNNGSMALFWQLVPQSRGADDGFALILGRDPKTEEVFKKYSVSRAPR